MQIGNLELPEGSFVFGFPEEWVAFQQKHPKFVEALAPLAETAQHAIRRSFIPKSPADELVFFMGALVLEDFTELWLLAGNGCGTGALKILRGMYERTVTAAYVSKFPDEARRFWRFGAIAHRRVLNNAKLLYGSEQLKGLLSAAHLEEVEKNYLEARHDFEEIVCARCELFRIMFSWSKYDLSTMARKAGYGLEYCYFNAYSIPTQQAHSTVMAVSSHLKTQEDGKYFDRDVEHLHAPVAAMTGHVVLLKMLRVQNSYFSLGLESEIRQLEADCKTMWPGIEANFGKGM